MAIQPHRIHSLIAIAALLAACAIAPSARAQMGWPPGPQVISPEVSSDRQVTFRFGMPLSGEFEPEFAPQLFQ